MSNLAQFTQSPLLRTPTSIVNRESVGGVARSGVAVNGAADTAARRILSGAVTGSTWKSVLSVTGSGVLSFLAGYDNTSATRALGVRLTLDGVVLFAATSTSAAVTAGNTNQPGMSVVGSCNASGASYNLDPHPFAASMQVEVLSSLSETDGVGVQIIYRLV